VERVRRQDGEEFFVIGVETGPLLDFASRQEARAFLETWLSDPSALRHWRDALSKASPGIDPRRLGDDELLDQLERLLADGRILVGRAAESRVGAAAESADAPAAAPPAPRRAPEAPTTWVEFKVVWHDTGQPVPHVRLRVTTPDGNENFHTTNASGIARLEGIPRGECIVRGDLNAAQMGNTLAFVGMGEAAGRGAQAAEPRENPPPQRTGLQQIALIDEHKVKTGESLKKLAEGAGLTWKQLTQFNWGTDDPQEINNHLRDDVGCTRKTADGYNYLFGDTDDPGIVYIPTAWEQTGLASGQTHVVRVAMRAHVTRRRLYFEDSHYLLPNTDYVVLDPSGAVRGSGRSDPRARVDLPESFQDDWTIVCGSLRRVAGRVLLPGGQQPLAGQSVDVVLWTGRSLTVPTNEDGRIELQDVPEGSLAVRWRDHQAVFLVDRDVGDATFQLSAPDTLQGAPEGPDRPDDHDAIAKPPGLSTGT